MKVEECIHTDRAIDDDKIVLVYVSASNGAINNEPNKQIRANTGRKFECTDTKQATSITPLTRRPSLEN